MTSRPSLLHAPVLRIVGNIPQKLKASLTEVNHYRLEAYRARRHPANFRRTP
jgi:hypothetical protein